MDGKELSELRLVILGGASEWLNQGEHSIRLGAAEKCWSHVQRVKRSRLLRVYDVTKRRCATLFKARLMRFRVQTHE